MIGNTIDFKTSIIGHAKARNLVLSQDELASLGQTLNSVAEIEAGDQPVLTFSLGGDRRGDLTAALDLFSVGFGKPAGTETGRTTPTALTPGAQSATERAIELNRAAKAGSGEIKKHQAEELVKLFGSPWITGNATHRAFVQNCNPQLAARLRAEAGARA